MSFSLLRRTAPATAARAFSTSARRELARIQIIGNLADTPELQATSSGRDVLRYALASNYGRGDNKKTSWFRVSSFVEGPQRDFLLSLPKGSTVFVEGDVSTNTYTDSNGATRNSFNVVQRSIEVLKRPYQGNEQQGEH